MKVLIENGSLPAGKIFVLIAGKDLDDGVVFIELGKALRDAGSGLATGDIEDIRVSRRVVKHHGRVLNLHLVDKHAHDQLNQQLGIMNHDHPMAGGF